MDDYKIALGALLDANAKGDIDKQLNAIKDLSVTISKATLSNDVINDIKRQLTQNGIDLKLVFGNVGQITNQAKQTGQQIGQQIQSGINSAIQKGNLQKDFFFSADKKNDVAKRAQEYFRGVSNGIVTVTEQMTNLDNNSELRGFIVNIKNAKGEVESLRYSLRNITDDNGNVTGQKFAYTGGAINDAGAIKQIQAIENAFADYTAKLAQFESTNTNILSGLTTPLQDFETKLAGLKNGTATIDEVKNSFKLLGAEASKVTANFTGQLSKTDSAIRKLAQGDEIMDGLKASFKGLSNAPKDINTELNKVSKLLREVRNVESQEGRTANWSAKYREWSDEVDKLKAKLSVLQKQQASMTTPQIFKTSDLRSADIPYMTKVSNTIEKQMGEIQKMANAKGWQNFEVKGIEKADGQIKSLTLTVREADGALKQFEMQRAKLQGSGKAQTGLMQVGDVKIIETASQAQAKLAQQTENANAKLQEQVNKIQLSMSGEGSGKSYSFEVTELIQKYKNLGLTQEQAEAKVKGLSDAHNNLNTILNQNVSVYSSLEAKNKAIIEADEKRTLALNKANNEYREMALTAPKILTDIQRLNKVESMQKWADNNSKAVKRYGDDIKRIIERFAQLDVQMNSVEGDKLVAEFKQIQEAARKTGNIGMTAIDKFTTAWKKFGGWTLASSSLMRLWQEAKEGVQFITELDDALTDVAYTSDVSKAQLENLGNSAIEMAKDLNTSAENVLEAVKIYSTANATAEDILRKAQPAIMLSNISGMSGSESSKTINTSLNQFEIEDTEENLLDITDTLQYVSSQLNYDFTEGIKEITEGIEASGSVAKNAGLNMQEYATMVGVAVEKTGQSGSTIGNAYKTIFSRITKASSTEGTLADDISAAEKSLRSIGVEVRDSEKEFRDLTDILADLGKVWDSLSSVEKSNVGFQVAGTRQLNVLNSLFGSWEQYSSIIEDIDERTGETLRNQEVYAESLKGHLGDLSAVGQSVWNNVIKSDTLKMGVDLLTGLLTIVDSLTKSFGLLGTIGVGAGIFAGFKNVGYLKMPVCPHRI